MRMQQRRNRSVGPGEWLQLSLGLIVTGEWLYSRARAAKMAEPRSRGADGLGGGSQVTRARRRRVARAVGGPAPVIRPTEHGAKGAASARRPRLSDSGLVT
jgi:hypothetical protein